MRRSRAKILALIAGAIIVQLGDFSVNLLSDDVKTLIQGRPWAEPLLWSITAFCILAAVASVIQEHREDREVSELALAADPTNRTSLLKVMRNMWIVRILRPSLRGPRALVPDLADRPGWVRHPCDLMLRRAGMAETPIPSETPITEIYDRSPNGLLILGEPGAGKTTLLLELADELLDRAEEDSSQPLPVVLRVSEWRPRREFATWVVEQLESEYGIPRIVASPWLATGGLILLLDGLDEAPESARAAFIDSINEYRRESRNVLRPLVVTSRTEEYRKNPDRFFGDAVEVQPLSDRLVDRYLEAGGPSLAGLRAFVRDDPQAIRSLLSTPLMLYVAATTFADRPTNQLRRKGSVLERRRELWDGYIERALERKQEEKSRYSDERVMAWLSWLAYHMASADRSSAEFRIEDLQPSDLVARWERWLVRWSLSVFAFGAIFATFWRVSPLLAVTLGLGSGYLFEGSKISNQKFRAYRSRLASDGWASVISRFLLWISVGALAAAFVTGILFMLIGLLLGENPGRSAMFGSLVGLPSGAMLGTTLGAASTIYTEAVPARTRRPNEGVLRSMIVVGLVTVLGSLCGMLGVRISFWVIGNEFVEGMWLFGLVLGALIGLSVGMAFCGGKAVLHHLLIRRLLVRNRRLPWNVARFCDWAVERAILRRVGGGWIFYHATLQDRFVEIYHERRKGGKSQTARE